MNHRSIVSIAALVLAYAPPAQAQKLRHGVADAALVVVAEPLEVKELGEHLVLHRFRVVETLKGSGVEELAVLEAAHVADAPTPRGEGRRLLCLAPARRSDAPKDGGPFWRATGYAGDCPSLDDSLESRDLLALVRALTSSERGTDASRTADTIASIVLRSRGIAQREAAEVLRERDVLRGRISRIDLDQILARAVAETKDVDLKVTLASLCAEAGMRNVVEALCTALPQCQDERFAQAVGRIATHVHGERATAILLPFLQQARGATNDALLLAIGATRTDSGLEHLLALRERQGAGRAVDAALRAHGSARAIEAVEPKKSKDGEVGR